MSYQIKQAQKWLRASVGIAAGILVLMAVGMSWVTTDRGHRWDITLGLVTVVLGAAALTVGAFVGFFFGLPRGRVVDDVEAKKLLTGAGGGEPLSQSRFLANTNLIKISDWGTTIVTGLTLVSLGKIIPAGRDLAGRLKAPLGGYAHSSTVGLSVLIAGVIVGFLLTYLWTSVQVRLLFEEIERGERFTKVPNVVGLKLPEAYETIQKANLMPQLYGKDLVRVGSADKAKEVKSQHPAAGEIAAQSDPVELTIL